MSEAQGLASLGNLDTGPIGLDRPLTKKELEQISGNSEIAESALITINHGIAAIGSVLAGIGSKAAMADDIEVDSDLISSEALGDIGFLLEGLGNLSHQLSNTISCIDDKKIQHAALTGKHD